ncbi:glycosyltransferase [Legionella taurinensis]|uniref:Glycosyltransferase n=1 Tax=Legionella taurinensis TaxID=70611 RepID=A0A3A5LA17_9GAMM|nr:glycosyltransferase [Legionella taurinensis]RJT43924.1 glycosyltransferase [Legionella taurinensis]RJT65287.1 glycosyltransferase [Legionella taurinensis]STY26216.1 glycosyl transferase, family 2 [Legionella taurinensis]
MITNSAHCHFSIIIPAHNEEAWLPASLHSIDEAIQTLPSRFKGEVIVVNNNSTDKTAEIAAHFGARVLLEPVRNIARVRNSGARDALGDLLIFIDADTLMSDEMLHTSVSILQHPEIIAGSFLLKADRDISLLVRFLFFVWNQYAQWCTRCAGSFVFCKKDAFLAIGGFDEEYYVTEDISLSIALKRYAAKHGKKVVIYKKYVIMCLRKLEKFPPSFHLLMDFISGLFFRNRYKQKKNCKYWY